MNTNYTFESFMVGESNSFAYNSCLNVAKNLGDPKYNPLYIYGSTGLGKTHLIHAIVNYVMDNKPESKAMCISCQELVDQLLQAMKEKNLTALKDKYKELDLLIIDDIEVLNGKYETQNIVFDIFNSLYSLNKQIVFSGNKAPKELGGIQKRIISRFTSGQSCEIKLPDYDTKVAVLRKKEEENSSEYKVDEGVIDYIAKNINSIRKLEGCLNKIIAVSRLEQKVIGLDLAKDLLLDNMSIQKDDAYLYSSKSLGEILATVLEKMNDSSKRESSISGISSGYRSLDDVIGGYQNGNLIVVASRPGVGKTSFALNTALNISKEDKKVVFFSLEMDGVSVAQRMLSIETNIPIDKSRLGKLADTEWESMLSMAMQLSNNNIIINDDSYLDVFEINKICKSLKKSNQLDCVIIDYFQFMHFGVCGCSGIKINSRQEEVSEISRSIKLLSKELNVPIIVLAQMSRRTDEHGSVPISDTDSQIGQYADLVIMMARETGSNISDLQEKDIKNGNNTDGVILNILKNKNGNSGKVKLNFDRNIGKLSE